MNVIRHYDLLIEEGNDPFRDPPQLSSYMDKWDGEKFIRLLNLTGNELVLEIGVGTGRLAVRALPKCREFIGIDISPKTIERAKENIIKYNANVDTKVNDGLTNIKLKDEIVIISGVGTKTIKKT